MSDEAPNNTGIPANNPNCNSKSCYGRVWIYYSDATKLISWGSIARTGIDAAAKDIMCNQLGYKKAVRNPLVPAVPPLNDDSPVVWLTEVSCAIYPSIKPPYNNILQCNPTTCKTGHDPQHEECNNHISDLVISCSKCYVGYPHNQQVLTRGLNMVMYILVSEFLYDYKVNITTP